MYIGNGILTINFALELGGETEEEALHRLLKKVSNEVSVLKSLKISNINGEDEDLDVFDWSIDDLQVEEVEDDKKKDH
ncbi:hypothetical protein [Halalkalibacter oceani]|uniref:hypothetical protein n=1 Tax=Halalkalibacter oceani TaxID=1653776 RepID=UPI003391F711